MTTNHFPVFPVFGQVILHFREKDFTQLFGNDCQEMDSIQKVHLFPKPTFHTSKTRMTDLFFPFERSFFQFETVPFFETGFDRITFHDFSNLGRVVNLPKNQIEGTTANHFKDFSNRAFFYQKIAKISPKITMNQTS